MIQSSICHDPVHLPTPAEALGNVRQMFRDPPRSYCPIPFYWWAGGKLQRERLAWQLDQLCRAGIFRVVISYPHTPSGGTDLGDPPLFSREWWDIFRWFVQACRERGMTLGFQDYTITGRILQSVGAEAEGMQGGRMSCMAAVAEDGESIRLDCGNDLVIGAWACPERDGALAWHERIELDGDASKGVLEWRAGAGKWHALLVFARLVAFDPMHPEAGCYVIRQLYEPFARECPGEVGRTLDLFFQDELDFGARMPFWSNRLFEVFSDMKGYDLRPVLPALWHDIGMETRQIRLDYADVVVSRLEECYFKPVFEWHDSRGVLFGHDNCGRGGVDEGREHYGDYFRAMRWFSAPGCDDPKIQGLRSFKGLKVNSSIAHLYQRPRVWLEAFHSSGWGTRPAEVLAALHQDFAYGATLVNPHGLYYSTHGGWWEWAPPDTHFRQPYWHHIGGMNRYLTRMCWILSQGVHRCDVALVYPTDALAVRPADASFHSLRAHTGNLEDSVGDTADPQPEATAFGLGRFLFERGCDFDYIDSDTLASCSVVDGTLRFGLARYRVLVFPAMEVVRKPALEAAAAFVQAGGLVIAYGRMPVSGDGHVPDDLLDKAHGQSRRGVLLIKRGYDEVLRLIRSACVPAVTVSEPVQVLHRELDKQHVFFLYNPSRDLVRADVLFGVQGEVSLWDAWTGETTVLGEAGRMSLDIGPCDARLLAVDVNQPSPQAPAVVIGQEGVRRTIELDATWQFMLHPTLDNCFGDFRLPASEVMLGPEARVFRWMDEFHESFAWREPAFDDREWQQGTCSYGARLEVAGPLDPDDELANDPSAVGEHPERLEWRPYEFSLRWGIENDPFLKHWLSGPHGLKGRVPDDFIDFHAEKPGEVCYLRCQVVSECECEKRFIVGGRCAYQVWINGRKVAGQDKALPPGIHPPWGIPHYDAEPVECHVSLKAGVNRVLLRLVQPDGQRTRGYFAFDPPLECPDPRLRWFADGSALRPQLPVPAGRRAIRFRFAAPPGLSGLRFVSRGPAKAWVDGVPVDLMRSGVTSDGCMIYQGKVRDLFSHGAIVAIRVEAPDESRGCDAIPEPVAFHCGVGTITSGDWCEHGLGVYSGIGEYSREISMTEEDLAGRVWLELDGIGCTAEIRVNEQPVATLVAPPWKADLTGFLRPGLNRLTVAVANTLANHYSVGIPTPYAFQEQTRSGLLGEARLIIEAPFQNTRFINHE